MINSNPSHSVRGASGGVGVGLPLRITLQRWGLSPEEALSALEECRAAGRDVEASVLWQLGELPGVVPDLVIHLVDAKGLVGTGAAKWNAMGPVHALRSARGRGRAEIAIVMGGIERLPVVRAGCWVQCGKRRLPAALQLLLRVLVEPGAREATVARFRELAAHDIVAQLFCTEADDPHGLIAGVEQALTRVFNTALTEPTLVWLVSPEPIHSALKDRMQFKWSGTALDIRATQGPASPPCAATAIRGLIGLPWPDLVAP
ncbi:hypothetical protein CURE108131_19195 [Cupriavidus respiraculi]|uniref:Uncharacterized protein n=1 Tax=Cupriavidus respiraculi TaxID=195930 RepID=A0ABN7ZGU7_9BURK|nr:hypothetical protein [Cupriavidus respiraculi]MBY4949517.1 hypothetical protein [Cupriavidus respiraculi]CAG9183906.1 hypothetical protein LMG21510_04975 [Cupriavidus respiraculi]